VQAVENILCEVAMKIFESLALLALSAALAAAPAIAEYPAKPVRLVVPFAAGGPTDTVARAVAQQMTRSMGQPVIVENKPGADGAIAAQTVAAAAPDGYTLLFASSSLFALPYSMKPAPFDTLADFAPVSSVARFTFCLYVNPAVPAKTPRELIAYARANPGTLNFATSNMTEHLAAALFMKAAGIDMVRVPYKGAAQAMPDLVAGLVHVNFGPMNAGLPFVRDGRLRLLATLLPERSSQTPDTPTLDEAGVPGVTVQTSQVIVAPAKTPRDIVDRLSREVNLALGNRDVRAQLEKQAIVVEGSTPEGLRTQLEGIDRMWAVFVRENNLVQQ
jgi:tripartite-type tricarboxylate transporter receptor subunit TctC